MIMYFEEINALDYNYDWHLLVVQYNLCLFFSSPCYSPLIKNVHSCSQFDCFILFHFIFGPGPGPGNLKR